MPKPPVKTRASREAPPPSKWARSRRAGTYFEVRLQRKRNHRGEKLYRCYYPKSDILGNALWTLQEIEATNPRWLKNKPTRSQFVR